MIVRHSAVLFLFASLLASIGCGKPVGNLHGKVEHNGSPLASGQVSAVNEKNEVIGVVSVLDGTYRFTNLPVGPVTLTVQTHQADGRPLGVSTPPITPPGVTVPPEVAKDMQKDLPESSRKALETAKPVPLRYTDAKQSGLKTVVVSGETMYDIAMTGEGEIPQMVQPGPGGPLPPGVPPPPMPPFRP